MRKNLPLELVPGQSAVWGYRASAFVRASSGMKMQSLPLILHSLSIHPMPGLLLQKGMHPSVSKSMMKHRPRLRAALALNPTSATTWFSLGIALHSVKDYDGAMSRTEPHLH